MMCWYSWTATASATMDGWWELLVISLLEHGCITCHNPLFPPPLHAHSSKARARPYFLCGRTRLSLVHQYMARRRVFPCATRFCIFPCSGGQRRRHIMALETSSLSLPHTRACTDTRMHGHTHSRMPRTLPRFHACTETRMHGHTCTDTHISARMPRTLPQTKTAPARMLTRAHTLACMQVDASPDTSRHALVLCPPIVKSTSFFSWWHRKVVKLCD